jgi:hypothetical protein
MLEPPKALNTHLIENWVVKNLKILQWTISRKPTATNNSLKGSSETTRGAVYFFFLFSLNSYEGFLFLFLLLLLAKYLISKARVKI